MIEYMLSDVVCHEFEKAVGKNQYKTKKALHVGFGMSCGDTKDQYNVCHMYIYAPCNYVYMAIQRERIDAMGKRHVGPMEMLAYHDSCWRDAIQTFIFKNRGEVNVFHTFKSLGWCDVVELTETERKYLEDAEQWRRVNFKEKGNCPLPNPFDNRGIWAGKAQ